MILNIKEYSPTFQALSKTFDCGNSYLNQFIRSPDALEPGIGKTYVCLSDDAQELIGYYNISCGALDELDDGRRCKIGGAIHLGYFAVDSKHHHELQETTPSGARLYLSDLLLEDCLARVEQIRSSWVGTAFVTLASSEAGEKLYRRHGFDDLDDDITFSPVHGEDECICLYLPLDY